MRLSKSERVACNFADGAVSVELVRQMKIKYLLPAGVVALMVLLLRWNNSLRHVAARWCDVPGPAPADRLLMSLNAPLIFQSRVWYDSFSYPWNVVTQLGAVGLFWYWVAVNISSWRRGGSMITISWRPARFALDALLILLASFSDCSPPPGAWRPSDTLTTGRIRQGASGLVPMNRWPTRLPPAFTSVGL
jgi:hypothetical protein